MSRFLYLFPLLLLLCCTGCTLDQQELGLEAERTYVDLLYALQSEDAVASRTATQAFDERIRALREVWYRPMTEEGMDNLRYHVDQAECAYEEARESIEQGDLDRALVQLDRAVFEIGAGDRSALEELYVGSIYDFIAAWLEVDYQFRDLGDSVEWLALGDCTRDAHRAWNACRGRRPSPTYYFERGVDEGAFNLAHANLHTRLNAFYGAIRRRDLPAARDLSNEVSEALWDLLLPFGTGLPPSFGEDPAI
ncbi:MAG: hypothetical protein WA952_08240 [Lewinella sp.]